MGQHDKLLVKYAVGKETNLAKARNKTAPWAEFCDELSTPVRTSELREDFDAMSKDEQDRLKGINGWISTAQCKENKRNLKNILPRNLLSLDLDYCSVTLMNEILEGESPLSRFESFIHPSRRHTATKPRLRMFLPLKREVNADEYHALVRIVSWILDGKREPIIQIDRVSARPAQMMFKPTVSKDMPFFVHRQEGELLDPDYIFKLWKKKKGDPNDLSTLPIFDTETDIRKRAERSENPKEKAGVIGAFCRAYTIEDAMDAFLPGTYIPVDSHSEHPRYTYSGSTSSSGAIVYDDGLFLYSNHGHDPCCEKNVNAFDLVRLHKFGDLDDGINEAETKPTQLPSYRAMVDFARKDPATRNELMLEKFSVIEKFEDESDEAEDAPAQANESGKSFSDPVDLIGDYEPTKKKKKNKTEEKATWRAQLEVNRNDEILPSIFNYSLILQNDSRLVGAIADNEFTGQLNLRRTITPKIDTVAEKLCEDPVNGTILADKDDTVIRAIMDAPADRCGYNIRPSNLANLRDAIVATGMLNVFNPVKEYLESLTWDGKPRIDLRILALSQ